MRLKRDTIQILFKTEDAGEPSTIEATFASSEAMDRYFVNHDLAKKHRRGSDGEIYPKFKTKQAKFYSLEEVKRKKKVEAEVVVEEVKEKEDEDTKETPLDELLEEPEDRPEDK